MNTTYLSSFGRRHGRKLTTYLKDIYQTHAPSVAITSPTSYTNLSDLFECPVDKIWLEIGFGGGEHLVSQINSNPKLGMIGCEPFINGVASLLNQLDPAHHGRVRLFTDDVRELVSHFPPQQLDRIYILFPDPWPKKRHYKRRLIQKPLLDLLYPLMKPGAELRIASDHYNYVEHILTVLWADGRFEQIAGPHDVDPATWDEDRPQDWPPTRYEQKAIRQGIKRAYMIFRKV